MAVQTGYAQPTQVQPGVGNNPAPTSNAYGVAPGKMVDSTTSLPVGSTLGQTTSNVSGTSNSSGIDWGSILGNLASVYNGVQGGSAPNNAANSYAGAAKTGIATQYDALNKATSAYNQGGSAATGYMNTGVANAQNTIGSGTGLAAGLSASGIGEANNAGSALGRIFGANGGAPDYSGFENNPGYKFAVQQGDQAINRQAAAGGNLYSTSTLANLGNYNQGMAAQQYQSYVQNLLSMAGIGNTAASNAGSLISSGALASGNAALAGGQTNADIANQVGQAIGGANMNTGQGVSNAWSNIGQYNATGVQNASNATSTSLTNPATLSSLLGLLGVGGGTNGSGGSTGLLGALGKLFGGGGSTNGGSSSIDLNSISKLLSGMAGVGNGGSTPTGNADLSNYLSNNSSFQDYLNSLGGATGMANTSGLSAFDPNQNNFNFGTDTTATDPYGIDWSSLFSSGTGSDPLSAYGLDTTPYDPYADPTMDPYYSNSNSTWDPNAGF
jgi:hypothetical protein